LDLKAWISEVNIENQTAKSLEFVEKYALAL